MTKIPRIRLFNSVVKDKMPNPETSKIGEIYINANAERPFLSTKTSDGEMVKVIAEDEINTKIQAEATARQEADKAISDSIKNIDISNKADTTALTKEISDRKQEDARIEGKITDETTARENAVNDLTTSINDLKENGGKVQDVKVNGVSVVANKVANIDLTSKADATALTQVSAAIEAKADATALTEVSTAVESKADNAALSKEIEDRKSEIARVEGKIPTDTLSADELTKDEKAIAAAFQEIKINYDAQQLTINNLKKKVQEASKNQGGGKVDDVKVDGVSVVANKIANIDLSTKADATALTQVSEAIETKADTTAVTQVSTALTQEVTDRKSEITRVDGKISDEAAARQEADNAIKASIASIDLSTKADVSALTKEITDRKSEITRVEGLIPTIKVDDVKVDGVSVVANKVANIDLSNKADATALTQVSAAIEAKADTTALTEVSKAVEAKADSSALTQVSTALTQEISDRKSEITRVEGLIQGGGGSSSGGVSEEQLTDDEQTIAAAFQEQKINIDALRLSIETLKKRISSLEKALKAKA